MKRTFHTVARFGGKRSLRLGVVLFLFAAVVELITQSRAATVTTDKSDYAPYDTVVISGNGFAPDETVHNQVSRLVGLQDETGFAPWDAITDAAGRFSTTWYVFGPDLVGATLRLSSVGQSSGRKAQAFFTDSRTIISATLNGHSMVIVKPGAVISATVTVTTTGSGSSSYWRSTSWLIANSQGTGTCVDHPNHDPAGTYSETFFVVAPLAAGSYNAYFTAYSSETCGSGPSAVCQLNGAVVVDGTPPSAPSTPDLATGSDSGSSNSDDITWITNPTFTGTAEIGSIVSIYSDGTLVGSGSAEDGHYSLSTAQLTCGTHRITAKATDAAGNLSPASGVLLVTIDTVGPSVTIDQSPEQGDPTTASAIGFVVTFSEPVTDFGPSGVKLGGTAGASAASVSGGPTLYTVVVRGMTRPGTVTATIPTGVAHDAAGNGNAASTSTDNTVAFKWNQSITFAPMPNKTYGDLDFVIAAASSSGLPLTFQVLSGPAILVHDTVHITGAGTIWVRASQSGNPDFAAAPGVDRSCAVAKATPALIVSGGTFAYDGQPHAADGSAAGVGGLDLGRPDFTYWPPGDGTEPITPGTYKTVASFAGDANYEPLVSTGFVSLVILPVAVLQIELDGFRARTATFDFVATNDTGELARLEKVVVEKDTDGLFRFRMPIPEGTRRISAKPVDQPYLRRREDLEFADYEAQVDMTNQRKLLGGDLNGDGKINSADYVILRRNWLTAGPCLADINQDGVVDMNDYVLLQHGWCQKEDPE
jgi:hypothetical protein